MNFPSLRELYKSFYELQRAGRKRVFGYGHFHQFTHLIDEAYFYRRDTDTIKMLFDAQRAANVVMINRSEKSLPQSPKLQAALAKYRKGVSHA
ncbi:hypothetical protein RJ45_06175 [Photobacterium gaetbulicola]|uniref:Uncharacterized protein n=1 Tax=Photobacterium gaetbulicola TaxID=1295392 RepID=A0A0B9H0I7_9GAMM|nr:hypothetical protein [Photobacterium gaetbulicola]KHT64491.1 hypothetical protein RJ45_06175 [Photobacterium gaetbulicola]